MVRQRAWVFPHSDRGYSAGIEVADSNCDMVRENKSPDGSYDFFFT